MFCLLAAPRPSMNRMISQSNTMGDDRMFADLPETIARGEISDCIGAKRER